MSDITALFAEKARHVQAASALQTQLEMRFLQAVRDTLTPFAENLNGQLTERKWMLDMGERLNIVFTDLEGNEMGQALTSANIPYPARFEIHIDGDGPTILNYTSENARQETFDAPTAESWDSLVTEIAERMQPIMTTVSQHPWPGYFQGSTYVAIEAPVAGMLKPAPQPA